MTAGMRLLKYQLKPYDELQATLAAIPQPSDSPTSAAPIIRHKPTNGIPARISTIGMTPGGTMPRVSISTTAAINSVTHGTRNMPTVDISFAVVYCIEETGRLITNARFCFFRSFTIPDMGSMDPTRINAIKNQTVPATIGPSPPRRTTPSAIIPAPMENQSCVL